MNMRMIRNILGWILLFEAAFLLVPMTTAAVYGETRSLFSFLGTSVLCVVIGLLFSWKRPSNTELYAREGFVIVALSWIVLSFFGSLPFLFSGVTDSLIDALFETVSGFTTTGASVFGNVEAMPHAVLMWRSFTHWVGGMGVLVFIMAFVPLSGGQNMHIMKAESPGPSVSKLVPKVRTTALLLYSIYLTLTALEVILLLAGGMSVFDALNTAFSTAGTGGFGFRNDSFASFSPYLQIVVTVFMFLFSVNFTSFYLILCRKFREAFNGELRFFIVMVLLAIGVVTWNVAPLFSSVGDALRNAAFSVCSVVSTTGFSTADFDLWPTLSKTVLVLLMFVGACAGSTGGGIKVSRIVILFKNLGKQLGLLIHPKQVKKVHVDGHPIDHDVSRSVNAYMVCYLLLFVLSMLALSFDVGDLISNFTAVAATLNNIGPGLSLVGPTQNYAFFSVFSKAVLIFDMLAGRLELFPILLLFYPGTWKK